MPWTTDLFSPSAQVRLEEDRRRREFLSVPYFAGILTGETDLQPQAGIAVYVRGESGKLAAARIYDDADPPLGSPN